MTRRLGGGGKKNRGKKQARFSLPLDLVMSNKYDEAESTSNRYGQANNNTSGQNDKRYSQINSGRKSDRYSNPYQNNSTYYNGANSGQYSYRKSDNR